MSMTLPIRSPLSDFLKSEYDLIPNLFWTSFLFLFVIEADTSLFVSSFL